MYKIESDTLMLYWKKNTNWNSRDKTTMSEIKNILLDVMPDFEDSKFSCSVIHKL